MNFCRRRFLQAGVAASLTAALPNDVMAFGRKPVMTMGVIADLHHGLAPTALNRLEVFIQSAQQQHVDCILQLGDFNYGKPDSRPCMDVWNQFRGPKYHVLGNHDMDSYSKQHMIDFWSMPSRFYSFDTGGFHFVVLDRNNLLVDGKFKPYDTANFYVPADQRAFADAEQLAWLTDDLKATRLPTVVLAHQGLGMENDATKVRAADAAIETRIAEANRDGSRPRVVACLCGHHHIDRYNFKDRVHYLWINSASYYWVGEGFGRMAAYRDSLFCFAKFYADGSIEIEGRRTEWDSPTPTERGFPGAAALTPFIADRKLAAR